MTTADPGRAQERTTLAWRRTGLALLVGAVTIARLTIDHLGPVVLAPAALAAAAALWVVVRGVASHREAPASGADRATHDTSSPFAVLRDGRMPAVVALTLALLAVGELAAALGSLT
jgi:uncharacterized membrane protein YidH (DUF202 family)